MVKKLIRKKSVKPSLTEKELAPLILKANKAYHDDGKPIMTDAEYDDLVSQLEKLNPDHKVLQKVGNKPSRGKKVTLKNAMGSLPKVRIGEPGFDKWLKDHRGELEATDKLDGISASYGNKNGYYLYTRGDGVVGTDISHLLPFLKGLGTLSAGHEIRGELIISKSDFKGKLAKEYSNTRNLVAGVANRKGIHEAAKHVTFVVHEYVSPRKVLSKVSAQLKKSGFYPVKSKLFKTPTVKQIEDYFKERMTQTSIDIDGIVLNVNGNRVALKDINEVATAIVESVEWKISRFGTLKPVAIFKTPILLAGAQVRRATCHNAAFVRDNGIGKGAVVSVIRSGEVIPKIVGVIKKVMPSFPPSGTWEWDGDVDIVSTDENSMDQQSRVLSNFLSVLDVKNFKTSMMAKLVDAGIDTVEKLLKATPNKFEAAGFGNKQSKQLHEQLHTAVKTISHPKLSAACGIFPAGFGRRRMTAIFNAKGNLLFRKGLTSSQIKKIVGGITGVGPNIATDFAKYFPKYLAFLSKVGITPTSATKKGAMKGKSFAFTGFRDKLAENKIESKGGQVTGITRTTTYLVTLNPDGNTEKLKKARKLGIEIINPTQMAEMLK